MFDLAVVLALLAAAILMFAINKPRLDAVALIMLTALPFTGVLTMSEALAGFSDPNIVLIAALFVLGEGLVRTGIARQLGDWLVATAGRSEVRLIVLLMVVVCGLGATMSSTAVTAIFIPVALRISKNTGVGPGRLMMPLSFAALISGMMTLVATAPNLVVNGELERHGIEGFAFFSFTPFGLPVLALGIIYMSFAHRWLSEASEAKRPDEPSFATWIEEYKLADREYRLRVTDRSSLAGKTLEDLNLRHASGASILAVERTGRFSRQLLRPTVKMEFRAGDILLIDLFAHHSSIEALRQQYALEALPLSGAYFTDQSQEIGMAEVLLLPTSDLVGKTVLEAGFRSRFGLTVVGLRRGVVAYIVAPGSTIHGVPYACEAIADADDLPELPQWMEEQATAKRNVAADRNDDIGGDWDRVENIERARRYLSHEAPEAIEGHGGDETTFKVACEVRSLKISEGECLNLMLEHWNEHKAAPSWTPDDLETKVANAYKYGSLPPGTSDAFGELGDVSAELESAEDSTSGDKAPQPRLFYVDFAQAASEALAVMNEPLIKNVLDRGTPSAMYGMPEQGKSSLTPSRGRSPEASEW
jgi:di/tricarboxylate transporter